MVDSVFDDITQRRHHFLSSSEKLQHIAFEFCYAADLNEEQQAMVRHYQLPHVSITEDSLCRKVQEAINLFRPKYVLLHTGFVYSQHPEIFEGAFRRLKRSNPDVMFGLQLRPRMVADPQAFHTSGPVVDLQRLIFHEAL